MKAGKPQTRRPSNKLTAMQWSQQSGHYGPGLLQLMTTQQAPVVTWAGLPLR